MRKITKSILLLTSAVCLSSSQLSAVETDPVGYVTFEISEGYTPIGITFTKAPAFTGTVASATSNTITFNTTPTLDAESYYVEVLQSDQNIVGERVDISSASGSTVTIDITASHNTINDVSGFSEGSVVVIRPHFTIGDFDSLISSGVNSDDSFEATGSDQILLFENGFLAHINFEGEWYQNFGDFNVVTDQILPPGSGFFYFRNPDAGTPTSLTATLSGAVRMNNFVQKLNPGYQFVANGYPLSASPSDFGYSTNLEGSQNFETSESDLLLTWDNGFQVHLLFDDGAGTKEWYQNFGDFSVVENTDLITASNAYFVFIKNSGQVLEIPRPF